MCIEDKESEYQLKEAFYFFELVKDQWEEKDYGHYARNINPILFYSIDGRKNMLGWKGEDVWILDIGK